MQLCYLRADYRMARFAAAAVLLLAATVLVAGVQAQSADDGLSPAIENDGKLRSWPLLAVVPHGGDAAWWALPA